MKLGQVACVAFGLVLAVAAPVRADDAADAKAIIDKAIKAHGGEKLAKLPAFVASMKGKVHVMEQAIDFTGEVSSFGPEKQKVDIEVEVAGMKFRVIEVRNGDKGWIRMDNNTKEMDKDKFEEAKEQGYAGWVTTLIPLKDKQFKLATVGEIEIDKRKAVGVKVSSKGHRDIDLYFDKETGLLVKTETRAKDDAGVEANQETFYSDYKDVKGTKQAMKFVIKRDSKLFLEGEATEYTLLEKLDDSVFDKP
ncbi:MAG: hypothetical protein L0241_26215 [Planctomycetia bacterium]|nr:hypothetical protein [Planctomycetia bacterium]